MKNDILKIEKLLNEFNYFVHITGYENKGVTTFTKGNSRLIEVDTSMGIQDVVERLTEQGVQEREIKKALKTIQ